MGGARVTFPPRFPAGVPTYPIAPPVPAIPRALPVSPDDRFTGQGTRIPAPGAIPAKGVQSRPIEAVALLSGSIAVIPDDIAAAPPVVGTATVTVSPPGGGEWSRTVDVPRWGVVVDIPAGRVTVDVAQGVVGIAWTVAASPGIPRPSWTAAGVVRTIPAAGVVLESPPRFASSVRLAVYSGSILAPTATSVALAAPLVTTIPAQDLVITGVAANSEFHVQWEVFA